MDLENVMFAALLHDVGKFYQRTGVKHGEKYEKYTSDDFGKNGDHSKWSAEFIEKYWNNDMADLALYHHNPDNSSFPDLALMVQKADHHSSIERIDVEETEEVPKTPLTSIFSRISLDDKKPPALMDVPLKELTLEDGFNSLKPELKQNNRNLTQDYNLLWENFENEISKAPNKYDYSTILAILRKYMSTIPSAGNVSDDDISLYDHAKTTSALAVCRYLHDQDTSADEENVYLTVTGDISGIQNFIYKISSPAEAQSGMSRRLRGRSIYISLLNQAIADKIILDLGLCESNILFCGGGRFTIMAPNTDEVKERLDKIKDDLNLYLIHKFNAELYLSLAYLECSGNDLANFGELTRQISDKLNEDKKHKFASNLKDVFEMEDISNLYDTCPVCGNIIENKNDKTCRECREHEDIGRIVGNRDYMVKYYSNEKILRNSVFFESLGIGFTFRKEDKNLDDTIEELSQKADKVIVIRLNSTKFLNNAREFKQANVSYSFSFLGNTIPQSDRYPLYFEHLARISKGANKLGVVKMDVDNLGRIFSQGFNKMAGKDNKKYVGKVKPGATISRVSSLSAYLDMFFSGIINEIAQNYRVFDEVAPEDLDNVEEIVLELQQDDTTESAGSIKLYKEKEGAVLSQESLKHAIPTIHINYSGGDDLLVLGPYDDIIEFSHDFRAKFKQWTCENPSISISAGISIINPKFPIGKAVDMADANLEKSKECGRDKITLFGETVDWDTKEPFKGFNELMKYYSKLESLQENNKISSGFVYSLLKLWNQYIYIGANPNTQEELFDENMRRIGSKRFVPQVKYKLRTISDKKIREEIDKETIQKMPWIKIPVSLVSLRMR